MTHPPTPRDVRFEHLTEALGIDARRPRISWSIDERDAFFPQAAVEIRVQEDDGTEPLIWTVATSERVLVPWPAEALGSKDRRRIQVRIVGADGVRSDWSEPAAVEMGLLDAADWRGSWVGPSAGYRGPLPLVRKEFQVGGAIARARLYITAHGVYDVEINGIPVSDDVLAPGWQAYQHRLKYQTYDVTEHLAEGANAIGVRLGDGWYRGRLGFFEQRALYGEDLAVRAQLEVRHPDGSMSVVSTDDGWTWCAGPIISSDLYDGEFYDASAEVPGWSAPSAPGSWERVEVFSDDAVPLVSPSGPSVRPTQELSPVDVFESPAGKTLIDFGQNIVGVVRITVEGEAGRVVTIRHAEVLEDGELGVRPLRTARATDAYRLKGGGAETWVPSFTLHGFRYIEVDGWPADRIEPSAVTAVVIHTDMERAGWFESDHGLLNRLHENVVWGMRGNFVDIPTDCPQRDERLGWTGDISVFAPTAAYLYDCAGLLQSWLRDLSLEQRSDGVVPYFIPDVPFPVDVEHIPGFSHTHAAAWGDAAVTVPWALYEAYGDPELLRTQYPSMKSWVEGVNRLAGADRVWDTGFQFGDWLDPTAPPDSPGDAATDRYLVATAYFAHSTRLLADAADVLGETGDAREYRQLLREIEIGFRGRYVREGLLVSDTQTAYALGLCFDLLEPADREIAGRRLIELVREAGHTIATGFVGTPLILDALVQAGGLDDAYRLLLQTRLPSWLYTVQQGGTTIWERWDSMLPDGRINPGEMTSFNHYALGAVASWLHRTVGGLAPAVPGYRKLRIAPRPGGGLTRAATSHRTPHGLAAVSWSTTEGEMRVQAVIPHGVTAVVDLPGLNAFEVGAGDWSWSVTALDGASVS